MIRPFASICAVLALTTAMPRMLRAQESAPAPGGVLTYHGDPARSGNFVMPDLTWDRARSVHLDQGFHGEVGGHVYAQPLYWAAGGSGAGMVIVATEDNRVQALDAANGTELWTKTLGQPVPRGELRCGNIGPLGITGTPVIDSTSGTLFADANIDESGPHHRVFALSLKDGQTSPGWPVDIVDLLRTKGLTFNTRDQNERGALALLDGRVYVPYGGHFGDCGDYHGWVVGLSLRDPKDVVAWSTRARGGGIWAPGGVAVAGNALFVATGNTFGASNWSDGEAVFRLAPDLRRQGERRDFFAPADWRALDQRDADLGGTNPILINMPGGRSFAVALGKDGKAYLLDRDDLGGIGGALAVETVSQQPIRTAPAAYPVGNDVYIALQAAGARCPQGRSDKAMDLVVLKVGGGGHPAMSTAWCGAVRGRGSPIVTTTDGHSNPIVWMLGAEGDDRLHGFKGDTGEPLAKGEISPALTGLRHFQTLIAAHDHLYVAADNRLYAFAF